MCAKSSEALLWTLNLKHVTVLFWGTASINKKIIISIPKITISINLGCLMLNDIWMPQIVWNTPVTSTHKTFSWEWDWRTLFSQNTTLEKGVFGGPKWKRLEIQGMLLGGRRLTHPGFNWSPGVGSDYRTLVLAGVWDTLKAKGFPIMFQRPLGSLQCPSGSKEGMNLHSLGFPQLE